MLKGRLIRWRQKKTPSGTGACKGEKQLTIETVLTEIAQGAWNGGVIVDNSIFEGKGMLFKGNIPVNNETIQERVGVRTRVTALPNERIGVTAVGNLLETSSIDPSKIRVVIGATNVGDDKHDPGPLIRYPYEIVRSYSPNAIVFDLYAGCPGYNVSVEMAFVLSLSGFLKSGDITLIVGAENIHRAQAFRPDDTAHIIFGDDAMASALETRIQAQPSGNCETVRIPAFIPQKNRFSEIAGAIRRVIGDGRLDGIIVDNQLGKMLYRVPAVASRIQHCLVEQIYPEQTMSGAFLKFKEALDFYDRHVRSFAFDIMTLDRDPGIVEKIAQAYVKSGKYGTMASIFLSDQWEAKIAVHKGSGYHFKPPRIGVVDTHTQTHGCFANYIQAVADQQDVFGEMDGKGVFLYATRGASTHLKHLLTRNHLSFEDIDLLIEHQANFAMIPMTLEQLFSGIFPDVKKSVADFIANKMATNIHVRGNCSVVCMQRLPYDLKRGALYPDRIQGYEINANLEKIRQAKLILRDSVGAGMTRSSFLQRT
jgi:3-oxoacyl-[acyl-carrier-protein] synthase III